MKSWSLKSLMKVETQNFYMHLGYLYCFSYVCLLFTCSSVVVAYVAFSIVMGISTPVMWDETFQSLNEYHLAAYFFNKEWRVQSVSWSFKRILESFS